MLNASDRGGLAAGLSRAQAFSTATHGPWILAVACGIGIAIVGLATTSARSLSVARVIAEGQETPAA
jgi:hypothetical protein